MHPRRKKILDQAEIALYDLSRFYSKATSRNLPLAEVIRVASIKLSYIAESLGPGRGNRAKFGVAKARRHLRGLASVHKRAIEVFESPEGAEEWLSSDIAALGGAHPRDVACLRGLDGVKQVLDILSRIEHGVVS